MSHHQNTGTDIPDLLLFLRYTYIRILWIHRRVISNLNRAVRATLAQFRFGQLVLGVGVRLLRPPITLVMPWVCVLIILF